MEFRRIEKKTIIRHIESIVLIEEIKSVISAIYDNNLKFTMKVAGIGSTLGECSICKIKDNCVSIACRLPIKTSIEPDYDDIEYIEITCAREITDNELDSGGRWSHIILNSSRKND
jgi:hypothetical protein